MDERIFASELAMANFCDNLVRGWMRHQQNRGNVCNEDTFADWMDDFSAALMCTFEECADEDETELN